MLTGLGFKIKDKDRQLTSAMLYQLSLLCHGRPGSLPPGVKAPVLPATHMTLHNPPPPPPPPHSLLQPHRPHFPRMPGMGPPQDLCTGCSPYPENLFLQVSTQLASLPPFLGVSP